MRIVGLLMLASVMWAIPAKATDDLRANDAVELFNGMCMGRPADGGAFAHQMFDGHPDAARPLNAAELRSVLGDAGGFGWVMPTPHGAWVMLGYAPTIRMCAVLVREADPAVMKKALAAAVEGFESVMQAGGATVTPTPVETLVVDGVSSTKMAWDIQIKTHELAIVATLASRPFANKQHYLTFTVLH